ncbi:allantoate deiminase [Aquibacillus halophilus]|uniref:Allantoate deiminase n=1 Tax=Aquibacillus halophilus TaxID=930132 RepID=A0A6A8DMU0_9BACI|nr:allantoate deiminase [Aquibacillus halophilus]MRH44337.1 allantoate deiminase [Aquibacillus halophilus]
MVIKSKPFETKTLDVESMVKWLASFGQSDGGGVNRLLYSSPWVEAQHALRKEMDDNGLDTYFDSVGNLFGRLTGTEKKSKTILTGSHIDSVTNGGVYDGVYGIIASLIAVERLYKKYGAPKKTIEVVSLCEEEGSRFPITFWGSGNITGIYSLTNALTVKDSDGISLLEAMKRAGFDPDTYQSPKRNDIDSFIEVHVEQGVVLDKNKESLGLVSHIVGQKRFTIQVVGESNHAGTTPMPYRKDAMSVTAQLISYITEKAKELDPDLVATVGKLTAKPNVPNVIAGEVLFTLDIRHHQEEVLNHYCKIIQSFFNDTAAKNGMTITMEQWMDAKPVTMDPELAELSKHVATEKGIAFKRLISGAGHDAQIFGTFCPTALLFVPSKNGISHSPKEYTNKQDLENGVEMLTEFLYKLAY